MPFSFGEQATDKDLGANQTQQLGLDEHTGHTVYASAVVPESTSRVSQTPGTHFQYESVEM